MNLHIGCHLGNSVAQSVHAVALVEPHSSLQDTIVEERWESAGPVERFTDVYGNVCRRFDMTPENASFSYDAIVRISPEPEAMPDERERQHRVEMLPPELLHWLLPSRLCESDTFAHETWELFGESGPGAPRVQAVCDWINANIAYGVESVPTTTAREIFARRGGMCRDFAHLGVTFCRALSIPARYVFGYMPDIGIPGPFPPMDFHAWFEVYLGDRWWTYDARFNTPRIGRVAIGRGRDAVDVAMVTTYGGATLETMTVWSDEIATAAVGGAA